MEADAEMYNGMQIEPKIGSPMPFSRSVGWAADQSTELFNKLMRVCHDPHAHRLAKRSEYKKLLGTIQAEPMVAGWRQFVWTSKFTTDRYVLRLIISFANRSDKAKTYNPYSTDWEMHIPYLDQLLIIFAEPDAASLYEARLNETVRKMILADKNDLFPSLEVVDLSVNNNQSAVNGLLHYSE